MGGGERRREDIGRVRSAGLAHCSVLRVEVLGLSMMREQECGLMNVMFECQVFETVASSAMLNSR